MSAPLFEQKQAPAPQFGNRTIAFTVYGIPQPQGSSRMVPVKGHGMFITSANKKLRPWRQEVSNTALALNVPPFAKDTPIVARLVFYFKKPPSVSKRRIRPTVAPDIDKLCRSCFDSLTGILFRDDAQVVDVHATKHYGDIERVEISLREAS